MLHTIPGDELDFRIIVDLRGTALAAWEVRWIYAIFASYLDFNHNFVAIRYQYGWNGREEKERGDCTVWLWYLNLIQQITRHRPTLNGKCVQFPICFDVLWLFLISEISKELLRFRYKRTMNGCCAAMSSSRHRSVKLSIVISRERERDREKFGIECEWRWWSSICICIRSWHPPNFERHNALQTYYIYIVCFISLSIVHDSLHTRVTKWMANDEHWLDSNAFQAAPLTSTTDAMLFFFRRRISYVPSTR